MVHSMGLLWQKWHVYLGPGWPEALWRVFFVCTQVFLPVLGTRDLQPLKVYLHLLPSHGWETKEKEEEREVLLKSVELFVCHNLLNHESGWRLLVCICIVLLWIAEIPLKSNWRGTDMVGLWAYIGINSSKFADPYSTSSKIACWNKSVSSLCSL